MSEKRNDQRIVKKLRAEVHMEDGMTFSSSVDISLGGIFVSTPEPLNEGSPVQLSIKVSETETVDVSGIIRWNRDETDEQLAGMGVQFNELSETDKEKIVTLVNK